MSAVIDSQRQAEATTAEAVPARVHRLLQLAGEVAGRTVLAVGSGRLAALLAEAGAAEIEPAEAELEGDAEPHPEDSSPQLEFTSAYDLVLVAAGFESEKDPLPRIARACGVAAGEMLAWFPERKRRWFGRKPRVAEDELFHEPAWVKRLFEMAGATSCERIKAEGGTIVRARFDD